jgi:hypothetical protein
MTTSRGPYPLTSPESMPRPSSRRFAYLRRTNTLEASPSRIVLREGRAEPLLDETPGLARVLCPIDGLLDRV